MNYQKVSDEAAISEESNMLLEYYDVTWSR